uniref:Uncharacterized protein n=1 Tax=Eutreptiella gymnastica TaxID=73025 RepID=A0A7S4FSV2_9EUGL
MDPEAANRFTGNRFNGTAYIDSIDVKPQLRDLIALIDLLGNVLGHGYGKTVLIDILVGRSGRKVKDIMTQAPEAAGYAAKGNRKSLEWQSMVEQFIQVNVP